MANITAEQLGASFDALLASQHGEKFERTAEFDLERGQYTVTAKPDVWEVSIRGNKIRRGENAPAFKLVMDYDDDLDEVFGS